MKKISRIIAGSLLATGISFAQVQMGGHAAVNFSTLWGDGAKDFEIPWSLGAAVGAAAKVTVNEKFSVVPELNIDWRRQKNEEINWSTWAIELPILARYNALPQMYFEAGPQIAFLLSSEIEQNFDNYVEKTNQALETTFFNDDTGKPIFNRNSSKRLRSLYGIVSS